MTTIDHGFLEFLRTKDAIAANTYQKNPKSADILFRDPWSACVWWLKQEYDNTDDHREQLEKRVANAERALASLQLKLKEAKERPASCVPQGPFQELKCSMHGKLTDVNGEKTDLCYVCSNFTANISKSCSYDSCTMQICATCIDAHYPKEDFEFLHFLDEKDRSASCHYRLKTHHTDAKKLDERVRRVRDEYYDTEQHRADLEDDISKAEVTLAELKQSYAQALSAKRAKH